MATLKNDRRVLRKPSWAKKNVSAQELLTQAEEAVKNVRHSDATEWAVEAVADRFLQFCTGLNSPEIVAFFNAAKSLGTDVYVTSFTYLYPACADIRMLEQKLDRLSIAIDIPGQRVRVLHCPWNGGWAAEGMDALSISIGEAKDRFMAGNYSFQPSSWGKDLRKAVGDYAFLKSDAALRLDKKGNLISATSGGRIIFRTSAEALSFLYPSGYNPRESERLSLVIDDRFKALVAKVRQCPGAGSWDPL